MPDGLTVDSEGGVWVAYFGGGAVRRFDRDGCCDHLVEVGVPQVTSCCFNGANLDQLFITTAVHGLSAAESMQYPLSGSVFSALPGVIGRPATLFEVAS